METYEAFIRSGASFRLKCKMHIGDIQRNWPSPFSLNVDIEILILKIFIEEETKIHYRYRYYLVGILKIGFQFRLVKLGLNTFLQYTCLLIQ